jgi:hypothetical protein
MSWLNDITFALLIDSSFERKPRPVNVNRTSRHPCTTAALVMDPARPIGTVDFASKRCCSPRRRRTEIHVQNVALTDKLLLRTRHLENYLKFSTSNAPVSLDMIALSAQEALYAR